MRFKKSGFSLIELIMVLGITAVLIGVVGFNFAKQRQKGNLTKAIQTFAQDIKLSRSKALSQSTSWRIKSVNPNVYILEEWDDNNNTWTIKHRRSLPGSTRFASETVSGSITFDSRGFANTDPPELELIIRTNEQSQRIYTSMTGNLLTMDIESN